MMKQMIGRKRCYVTSRKKGGIKRLSRGNHYDEQETFSICFVKGVTKKNGKWVLPSVLDLIYLNNGKPVKREIKAKNVVSWGILT